MNPEHLQRLSNEYSLGGVQEVSEVAEGILNKNYVLQTTKGKYFIKLVRDKSRKFIPNTALVEELMLDRGIPAVCMLESTAGIKYVEYDADTYCVYPFIESDRSHTYSLDDYRNMGTLLGKIHKAGSHDIPEQLQERQWKEKPKDGTFQELEEYKARILEKDTRNPIDDTFLEYIELKLSLIPTLGMDVVLENTTLVQGDYHAGNLLIDKDSREIIGVCDWEKAEMAPRATELARSTLYICFEGDYEKELGLERAHAFLESYRSEYPISDTELRDGFEVRLRRHVLTSWMENHYYDLGDARGNHFVAHETRLITDFLKGEMLGKLPS